MCLWPVNVMSFLLYVIAHLLVGSNCCALWYFWCFGRFGELCFLYSDYVCMCVVNEVFQFLVVFDAINVDL